MFLLSGINGFWTARKDHAENQIDIRYERWKTMNYWGCHCRQPSSEVRTWTVDSKSSLNTFAGAGWVLVLGERHRESDVGFVGCGRLVRTRGSARWCRLPTERPCRIRCACRSRLQSREAASGRTTSLRVCRRSRRAVPLGERGCRQTIRSAYCVLCWPPRWFEIEFRFDTLAWQAGVSLTQSVPTASFPLSRNHFGWLFLLAVNGSQ